MNLSGFVFKKTVPDMKQWSLKRTWQSRVVSLAPSFPADLKRKPTNVLRASKGLQPARYPETGLAGLFDDLKALVSPYVSSAGAKLKQEFKNQLDKAQTKLENQIGLFLTTGQTLTELRARAEAQTGSAKPEVKSRAVAVTAKTNALLNNYNQIKTDAMNQAQSLSILKSQLETSDVFKSVNPLNMGSRVIELFNQYKTQLAKALTGAVNVGSRMTAHIEQTKQVESDVSSLESYAQGKGWQSAVSSIGSSYMNLTGSLAKIALVGVGVYLLAPSFIGRLRKS